MSHEQVEVSLSMDPLRFERSRAVRTGPKGTRPCLLLHSTHRYRIARAAGYEPQALAAIVQIALATDPATLAEKLACATAAIGASASLYTAAVPDGDRDLSCFTVLAGHPAYVHAKSELGPLTAHPGSDSRANT